MNHRVETKAGLILDNPGFPKRTLGRCGHAGSLKDARSRPSRATVTLLPPTFHAKTPAVAREPPDRRALRRPVVTPGE
eukprot:535632-Prorocentrum_minimum.AAC.1